MVLKDKINKALKYKQQLINMVVYEACSLKQYEIVIYFLESDLFMIESDDFHLFHLAGKEGQESILFKRLVNVIKLSSLNDMFWHRVSKRRYNFISKKYEQEWKKETIDYVLNCYENQIFYDFVNGVE